MQMMAANNSSSSSRPQTRIRNNLALVERRPLMLKDFLLRDDLSSCSSNGFKSFPRRQCCSTVRFLLEKDLKTNPKPPTPPPFLKRSRSRFAASSTLSALQKASSALINAVKLLPFPSSSSVKSPLLQSKTRKGSLLPRSLSRKLFKRSFWRKPEREENDEIRRWRLFRDFLEEQDKPSDQNERNNIAEITGRSSSTSSWSNSNSKSDSWTESECTGDSQNDAVEAKTDSVERKVGERVAAADGGDSSVAYSDQTAKVWPNEEKEQFSPVSVLDCPFEDDQEDTSSPFQCSLVRIEGTKQKLMKKIRKFENLAQIEPVDLERRIAQADSSDDEESVNSSTHPCSISNHNEENGTEDEARELLEQVKATLPPDTAVTNTDRLLLDFFREKIAESKSSTLEEEDKTNYEQEFGVVREWINGQPQEMFLGWEVKENRHVYVREIEKNEKWRNFDEEKEEVALELELDVLSSLIHEALLDMF